MINKNSESESLDIAKEIQDNENMKQIYYKLQNKGLNNFIVIQNERSFLNKFQDRFLSILQFSGVDMFDSTGGTIDWDITSDQDKIYFLGVLGYDVLVINIDSLTCEFHYNESNTELFCVSIANDYLYPVKLNFDERRAKIIDEVKDIVIYDIINFSLVLIYNDFTNTPFEARNNVCLGEARDDDGQLCTCFNLDNFGKANHFLEDNIFKKLEIKTKNCFINNLTQCLNLLFDDNMIAGSISIVDNFYRLRHEKLFQSLLHVLGLENVKSDIPFSEFGVDSNRTPDLILKLETEDLNLKLFDRRPILLIVEVTASSNWEKGMLTKGDESYGFKSKYDLEINELKSKGVYNVFYQSVVFDMSEGILSKRTMASIKSLDQFLKLNSDRMSILEFFVSEFSRLSFLTKEKRIYPSQLLFSGDLLIKDCSDNISFLYKKRKPALRSKFYTELVISNFVYIKTMKTWDRMLSLLHRVLKTKLKSEDSLLTLAPILDLKTSRFSFETNPIGLVYHDWREIIINNNKTIFFNFLMLDSNGNLIKSSDSQIGLKIIVRSDKIDKPKPNKLKVKNFHVLQNYENTCSVPEKFLAIEQSLQCQEFSTDFHDENYEDIYTSFLTQMDSVCSSNFEVDHYDTTFFPKMFSNLNINKIDVDVQMKILKDKHLALNNFGTNSKSQQISSSPKPSFTLPLASIHEDDYQNFTNKNIDFSTCILNIPTLGGYTKNIIEGFNNVDYVILDKAKQQPEEVQKKFLERGSISSQMNYLLKRYSRDKKLKKLPKIDEIQDDSLKDQLLSLSKIQQKISKELDSLNKGKTQQRGLVRVNVSGKNNYHKQCFDEEMLHFKKKNVKSGYNGVGINMGLDSDHKQNNGNIVSLISEVLSFRGECTFDLYDDNTYDDTKLLKDLKLKTLDNYRPNYQSLKRLGIMHSAELVSKMCHTLMFYSQCPYSSNYVRVENLGYKNILMLIRGGKKIFKTKMSKLYRLAYPVYNSVLHLDSNCQNYTFFQYENRNYVLTPWSLMNETTLSDGISMFYRIGSFILLNSNPEIPLIDQTEKFVFNILLAFHNRRKTEEMLANLRYILLCTMSDYSGLFGVMDQFIGFNYDRFQSWVRSSILINYPEYFKGMLNAKKSGKVTKSDFIKSNIKHVFTRSILKDTDDLALMIYSTFCMTKAPYFRPIERANNLKGILSIHSEYDQLNPNTTPESQLKTFSVSLPDKPDKNDCLNYAEKLFENDFNFDPKLCDLIGRFTNDYFERKGLNDEMQTRWVKILNQNWDSLATSTGLRGDIDDPANFWGKKGYFVAYRSLSKDQNFLSEIDSIISSELPLDKKVKLVTSINQRYFDKIKHSSEQLIFHAVDKVQWRGGREIYVMNLSTKLMQQPIENYVGYLCKLVDNEYISIPSNKRSQVIHSSFFEKPPPSSHLQKWYWSFDCSKWAPKSLFVKFAIYFSQLRCLPLSFRTHMNNYLSLLYEKKVYFNNAEVGVLLGSEEGMKFKDFLIRDDGLDGYFLRMDYSWMMGIMNYTSSLFHAFNQKYASYIISKTATLNFGTDCAIDLAAHSDDSGGTVMAETEPMHKRCLFLYEFMLKGCNHILSRKKSSAGKVYFEILSVIYIFNELLALLPKFLGGVRFQPTDKGPASDLMQSYSKSIEIMNNGSTFDQAYIYMKINSMCIWSFYIHRKPAESDYLRPVQHLGLPDCHPIMLLLEGSFSDIIRIKHIKGEDYLIKQLLAQNYLKIGLTDEGLFQPFKFDIKVRSLNKDFEYAQDRFSGVLESWSIANINWKYTHLSLLNFISKLNDNGFVGALVNETLTRRISRAYHMRSANECLTSIGKISVKSLLLILESVQALDTTDNVTTIANLEIKSLLGDRGLENWVDDINTLKESYLPVINILTSTSDKLYKLFSNMSLSNKDYQVITRTLKPTHVQLMKRSNPFSIKFNTLEAVSYLKEPDWAWALNNVSNLEDVKVEITMVLKRLNIDVDKIDAATIVQLLRKFNDNTDKDFYLYTKIPSEIRQIKTFSSLLHFLACNSFKEKEIKGIVVDIGSQMTDPTLVDSRLNEEIYNLSSALYLLIKMSVNLMKGRLTFPLDLQKSELLGFNGGDIHDFLDWVDEKITILPEGKAIKLQCKYLKEIVNNNTKMDTSILEGCWYYCFTRSQKYKNGYYGKGEIFFSFHPYFFTFELTNNFISSSSTNFLGRLPVTYSAYIVDILTSSGINISPSSMINSNNILSEISFGYDNLGYLCVAGTKDLNRCVECYPERISTEILSRNKSLSITYIGSTNFLVSEVQDDDTAKKIKVKCLNFSNPVVTTICKEIFSNHQDFEELKYLGFDNFTEFITSEILSSFGLGLEIKQEDLLNNYLSSRLFKIMKWAYDNDRPLIPEKLDYKIFPAAKGGLLRLLYNYQDKHLEERILNIQDITDPDIMRIRNEYPEEFTAVLYNKSLELYDKLYDKDDKDEFREQYSFIFSNMSSPDYRSKIISLMSYWGYSSLVGSIVTFDYKRSKKGFSALTWSNKEDLNISHYAKLFPILLNICLQGFKKFFKNSVNMDLNFTRSCYKQLTIERINNDISFSYSLCCYPSSNGMTNSKIGLSVFKDLFFSFLQEEDFCNFLEQETSKQVILSSIPFKFENRVDLNAMVNTLANYWCIQNNNNAKLVFHKPFVRLPMQSVEPTSLAKSLYFDFKVTNFIKYNGCINQTFFEDIMRCFEFCLDKKYFIIKSSISDFSNELIAPSPFFKPIRNIRSEHFDEDSEFADLIYELDCEEPDDDSIQSILEDIGDNLYEATATKNVPKAKIPPIFVKEINKYNIQRKEKGFEINLKIIIDFTPFTSKKIKGVRQIGENVIIITDNIIPIFKHINNCYVGLINTKPDTNIRHTRSLAYCFGSKHCTEKFWMKAFNLDMLEWSDIEMYDNMNCSIRLPNQEIYQKGSFCTISTNEDFKKYLDKSHENKDKLQGEIMKDSELLEKEGSPSKTDDVEKIIERFKVEMMSELNYPELFEKLIELKKKSLRETVIAGEKLTFDGFMTQFVKDLNNEDMLSDLTSILLSGDLKKDEIINIFQSPNHFTMAGRGTGSGKNILKDNRILAELKSLHPKLPEKVFSATLTISNNYKKLFNSQIKLWQHFIKHSKTKTESKEFLLKIFLMSLNDAAPTSTGEDDGIWFDLMGVMNDKITDEEEVVSDEDNFLLSDSTSNLKYRISGYNY
jgi:hypothetical protein